MMLRILFLIYITGLVNYQIQAQDIYFPPLAGEEWATISYEEAGWCGENVDDLLHYLDSVETKAFIALQEGKIVLEHYFDSFTRDSIWYWASAGKTLTAFAIGMAQEQGYLTLSDPSSTYLGEGWTSLTPQQEEAITVWHQLTMTSGLDDGVPENHCTLDTCLVFLADPGTRWAYHNAPYTLLDEVITGTTGQSLNSYLNSILKAKTGMNGLFLPIGYNNIFVSTPRSMARFGLLILNQGIWDGTVVMEDQDYFQSMVNTSQDLNPSYGYLWWLNGKESFKLPGLQFDFQGSITPNAPDDMIAAIGLNGQMLNIVPNQDFLFIRMGEATNLLDAVPIVMNNQIWARLNEVRCGTTAVREPEPINEIIYPNPSTGIIHIRSPHPIGEVMLTDPAGRSQSYEIHGNVLNLRNCYPGMYFLQWKSDGKRFSRKILLLQEW